uniref:Putative bilaris n=1 Tax=Rhipicephalus pulchellus TaxID=72859 RepID=L7LPL8_RHIPC
MATVNIPTVLALFFAVVACEASAIKGLEPGPPDFLPSEAERSGPPADTSPKEETPGSTASLPLAGIPGYDERCNMQATATKTRCRSSQGGKKRRKGWYLDPTTRKCLPSCDENAPFRYKVHCNAICRTEKACHFSATGFPCGFRALHPVYIYNRTQRRCAKAYDCDYYGNKFVTLKECRKTCVKGAVQQAQQQVRSTTGATNEPSNRIPHFLPPTDGLPAPSLPGASIGQFITGKEAAAGGPQQHPSAVGTSAHASTQMQSSVTNVAPFRRGVATESLLPGAQAVTGSTRNRVTAASNPSDASEESLSLDLGLGGPRGTSNVDVSPSRGAVSVSRALSHGRRFSLPTRLGPMSPQSGLSVGPPELEIVGVGTGPKPGPHTGPRPNRRRTGRRHFGISAKPGKADSQPGRLTGVFHTPGEMAVAGPLSGQRQPSSPAGAPAGPWLEIPGSGMSRRPMSSSGTNAEMPGSTMIPGIHHPGLSVQPGLSRPQISGPGRIPRINEASASEPSTVPDNLDLGLTTVRISPHTGSTSSSMNNAPESGLTKSILMIKHAQPGGGPPAVPPVPGTTKEGPVKTGISVPQAPSLPVNPVAPVLQEPSLPPAPPLNQNLLQTVPPTQKTGTNKEGPVKTATSSILAPSHPVRPVAPVLQTQRLPPMPPLTQNLPKKQPTIKKTGTSKEGPVNTGTSGPKAPSLPVIPAVPVQPKPSLPPSPSLNDNRIYKRPTSQKIESQITSGSQVIIQGSLNDERLVKKIRKGGNEGIQLPVSEQELPLHTEPLNEPPVKGFSLKMLPKFSAPAKLPGLLKIKTVRK